MRRTVTGLALMMALSALPVHAQEAEVAASVRATLASWAEGRYEEFAAQYHPDARGFFLGGGRLQGAFDVRALQAVKDAGFQADVTLEELDVDVYGDASTAVGYLVGTLTLPGGVVLDGTWRYSETRVRTPDGWKVVQYHVSRQEEAGG